MKDQASLSLFFFRLRKRNKNK